MKTKEMSKVMEVSLDEIIRNAAGVIRKQIEELSKQKARKKRQNSQKQERYCLHC